MKKIYKYISPGIFPFTICLFLITFSVTYRLFGLPSPFELSLIIERWFTVYGLSVLFIFAFFEAFFIIGMYFPGSLAIALAVYTLGKTTIDLFYIGVVAFIAFIIANIGNYFLGKYGYYKLLLVIGKKDIIENMQKTMLKHGTKTFYITGFFPNFFAITSVCAGISKLNFLKTVYVQFISLLFWVTVWTFLGSLIIKHVNLQDENQSLYILASIFLWGVYLVIKERFKKSAKMN